MLPMAEDNGLVWTFATVGALVSLGFMAQSERRAGGGNEWETMRTGRACGSRAGRSLHSRERHFFGNNQCSRQRHNHIEFSDNG